MSDPLPSIDPLPSTDPQSQDVEPLPMPGGNQPLPVQQGRVVAVGWVFGVLAALMVPWTAYLFIALPRSSRAAHYDLAWGGFDVGLLVLLGLTGIAAVRGSRWVPAASGATGAVLVVDAWFDVVTASTAGERWVALTMAVIVEVPLAAVCVWLALNGQELLERRVALGLWRRVRRANRVRPTPQ